MTRNPKRPAGLHPAGGVLKKEGGIRPVSGGETGSDFAQGERADGGPIRVNIRKGGVPS